MLTVDFKNIQIYEMFQMTPCALIASKYSQKGAKTHFSGIQKGYKESFDANI